MKKCLDEATIQAYADGELSAPSAQLAAAHLARCEACAAALAEAEQEGAFFAAAFAPDANVAVPSEVLRARIGAAVARLEDAPETPARAARRRDFGALLAPFNGLFSFAPRRAAAFASVLALVAFGFIFYAVRERTAPAPQPSDLARHETQRAAAPVVAGPVPPAPPAVNSSETDRGTSTAKASDDGTPSPRVLRAAAPRGANATRRPAAGEAVKPAAPAQPLVPGEENYRAAIASLERAVGVGADAALVPAARIEYERNIAVLDRAIEETRRAALRNPKDKDAVGFLMSAYQSKVELLTAVAEQTQVAAVGR